MHLAIDDGREHRVARGRHLEDVVRRAKAIGRDADELRRNGLAGTPAEIVDKIGTFVDAGAQRFYLQVLDLSDLDHLRLIAEQVVPSASS